MQVALILAEHHVKLVPDIALGQGAAGSGLASVMIARMQAGNIKAQA
jgi:hypothetical protein